jgi:GH25 family lysozyme M1 (1,4-beta-N-acetylmuramidase)
MLTHKGIDVSNNDGSIEFNKVAEQGIEYVYLKGTEGGNFTDKYMDEFYQGCKNNNLKVGVYHFLSSTSSPESQAQNFLSKN